SSWRPILPWDILATWFVADCRRRTGGKAHTIVQVLLVSGNWQTRALLRAQLIEEGLEVEAHGTMDELGRAPVLPHPQAQFPLLLVADVSRSDAPEGDLERLSEWARRIPVWVIASRSRLGDMKLENRGFEAILFRPVDMRELIERIK